MAKNSNDKYYTPPHVVKRAVEVLLKYFKIEDISEIIEPSAGDGAFIEEIKKLGKPYKFYDLYPEHPEVERMDFKELKLGYKPGRIFLGNPPFGNASSLFKRFVKGACEMGGGAVYVGPASHWNAKWGWKGLRLVYSEHLGDVEYYTSEGNGENKRVNTCLNVYMRGEEDMVDRASMVEGDIKITSTGNMSKGKRPEGLYFGYFGDGLLGRITNDPDKWEICWKIDILNKKREGDIMDFLEGFRERYYDEIKKASPSGAGVSIYDFKQKLAEWLYPTMEERLSRDVEIQNLKRYADGTMREDHWDEYEYYVSSWGSSVLEYYKEPKYAITFGIKILNERRRADIEEFLKGAKERYYEEVDKQRNGYSPGIKMDWFKEKLAEWLYPEDEYGYSFYNEKDMPIKKAEPVHGAVALF